MTDNELKDTQLTPEDNGAIRHLKQAIASGKHWYIALLEAIGSWNTAEEIHEGRTYRYIVAGEAFDWLLLAERLCQAVDGLLPADEKTSLLFYGKPPINLPEEKFKEFIGSVKHYQYLNFFYGITVEEALVMAVHDEVRKGRWISGYTKDQDTTGEVYRRIYSTTQTILLRNFRREKGYPQLNSISLTELKEFTYWCFKYRLKHCEKARVASDTMKALKWLNNNSFHNQQGRHDIKSLFIEIPSDSD